jgi:hypothetical protein
MRHPTSGRRRSRPHRPGRRPGPAPGSLPGDRRHQPGRRRAVDLVGPRSCGSPWRPSSRSAGVLPSRIRRKLTRPGQPIAMRNSSTSAIGRTTGRRPSTSAPSSPRSTPSSSPRRQTCRRSRSPRDRRATRMLARIEHDRWMAARKQAGVPTARNGPLEHTPHATGTRESANTRRRRTACSCGDF